jgi:hypothetical protein
MSGLGLSGLDRRTAALVVEAALAAVFDAALVRQLREDSPLTVLGMVPADAVCVADAIGREAERAGWSCALGDAELAGLVTVADLVSVVQATGMAAGGGVGA